MNQSRHLVPTQVQLALRRMKASEALSLNIRIHRANVGIALWQHPQEQGIHTLHAKRKGLLGNSTRTMNSRLQTSLNSHTRTGLPKLHYRDTGPSLEAHGSWPNRPTGWSPAQTRPTSLTRNESQAGRAPSPLALLFSSEPSVRKRRPRGHLCPPPAGSSWWCLADPEGQHFVPRAWH